MTLDEVKSWRWPMLVIGWLWIIEANWAHHVRRKLATLKSIHTTFHDDPYLIHSLVEKNVCKL